MSKHNGSWKHETKTEKRFDSYTGEPKESRTDWIVDATGRNLAVLCYDIDYKTGREILREDVAALMAAAPEMLEALQSVIEFQFGQAPSDPMEMWDRVRKIVAKAGRRKGQEQVR